MGRQCLVLILTAGFLANPRTAFLPSPGVLPVMCLWKRSMLLAAGKKKTELSKVFVLNISLIFHLFLNDLRQTLVCCCWPLWLTMFIYWMDVTLPVLTCIKFFPSQQKDVLSLMSAALPITGQLGRRWQCPFDDSLWLNSAYCWHLVLSYLKCYLFFLKASQHKSNREGFVCRWLWHLQGCCSNYGPHSPWQQTA